MIVVILIAIRQIGAILLPMLSVLLEPRALFGLSTRHGRKEATAIYRCHSR